MKTHEAPVQKKKASLAAPPTTATVDITPVRPNNFVENLLELQRTIGNQSVMRLLATNPPVQPMIQRAGADFGLKLPVNVSAFVTDAVAFWKKAENKDKPLQDYATFMLDKVNTMLIAKCTSQFITSGGDSGSFSRVTWNIKINTSKFSTNPDTDTVGELTADEAAEVADTIYHEMRHSQQYFTAAQIMAGEGKDAAAIVAELSIPQNIADLAVANPIKADKKNKDMIAVVKDWAAIGAGSNSVYKGLVNTFMDEPIDLYKSISGVDTSSLDAARTKLDTTTAAWKGNQLKKFGDEQTRLEGIKKKSKGDKLVLSHTQKIVKLLQAIVDTWEKDKVRSVATIQKIARKALALYKAVYAAYRDHLHEQDAWAVGGAAGKKFRSLANKK
jgi:hypothetical protein